MKKDFKQQVTIEERNGNEGETWSYILYMNEDEYQHLKYILDNDDSISIFERASTMFKIYLSNYTKDGVELINKHSSNGYKDRINFYKIVDINILNIFVSENYDKLNFVNIFYKAKGLKQI